MKCDNVARQNLLELDLVLNETEMSSCVDRSAPPSCLYKFYANNHYPKFCSVIIETRGMAPIIPSALNPTGYSLSLFGTKINASESALKEALSQLRQGNRPAATESVLSALKELLK